MTQEEKINTIDRIHNLISRKGTGKPSDLASRLEISERTVFSLINEMKKMSAPIYFCSSRNSYCYEFDVEFVIGFIPKPQYDIKSVDKLKILGGKSTYYENNFENIYSLKEFLQ